MNSKRLAITIQFFDSDARIGFEPNVDDDIYMTVTDDSIANFADNLHRVLWTAWVNGDDNTACLTPEKVLALALACCDDQGLEGPITSIIASCRQFAKLDLPK